MKLDDYRQTYYVFSGKASDVSRQLAFAGIALIWVLHPDKGAITTVPKALLWPALFFCCSLSFDLLHYTTSTAIWGWFSRSKERKKVKEDAELDAPSYLNWPALFCLVIKIASNIGAYFFVFMYIASQILAAGTSLK
ncbi:hypothetical protein [Dyella choica]|uniref:Uncharacterized protein n=1 Tax=Dyella choica TaxID=1927959 RepID=A0A3S0Q1L3_9GAMM|nr:hypothetical protein [Dyella choica]RUL68511.1 hypothetical protein EKH80_23425 [Dyella choica]